MSPPAYEALSYVWGGSADLSYVRIDVVGAHRLSITRNLDIAHRHLRHRSEPRSIWVDAIYINRKDDQEKSL
jgi:hypothetical protein